MKYAITPDRVIHAVADEKLFYQYHPDAQDVTSLPNIYEAFERQEKMAKSLRIIDRKFGVNQVKLLLPTGNTIWVEIPKEDYELTRCWG